MKTTLEISDPLFKEVKRVAAEEGKPICALVEEALRAALDQRRARRSAPFALRDAIPDLKTENPLLEADAS